MATKTTYTSGNILNNGFKNSGSYYKDSRINLLTEEVAKEFNTYRNWKEFNLRFPDIWSGKDDDGKSIEADPDAYAGRGVKSLFSNIAAVYSEGNNASIRENLNMPLLDSPENRMKIRMRSDCSIKTLVEESQSGRMGRSLYTYADFMYCKYLGKVPNNYMITLRKFPSPCSDHINFTFPKEELNVNKHMPDMGRLITWMGTPDNDMSNLLSYSYRMPWKENKAPSGEEATLNGGQSPNEGLQGLLSTLDGRYAQEMANSGGYGYKNSASNNWISNRLGGRVNESTGIDRNAWRNNVNRDVSQNQGSITSVMVPAADGLSFEQDIKITFDYELRSYDGVNGRSAMLDLLANILMVTYMQGFFFKGSYRSVGMHASNVYANLDIFKRRHYTPISFVADAKSSVATIAKGLWSANGGGKEFSWKNLMSVVKNVAANAFCIFSDNVLNQIGRPAKYAATSFISPTPTGQWHLTIGNPRNPILSMGNLILKDAKIEHYGPLGLDDFPTGLKVTVSLQHAKARDSVAIEQMYMHGDYRIYTPMGEDGIKEMYGIDADNVVDIVKKKKSGGTSKSPGDILDEEFAAYFEDLKNDWDGYKEKGKDVWKKTKQKYEGTKGKVVKYFGTFDFHHATISAGEGFTGHTIPGITDTSENNA